MNQQELVSVEEASAEFSKVLKSLGISADVEKCSIKGPMRRYSIRLDAATRPARLETLAGDMALAMRSVAPPLVRPSYNDGVVLVEFMYGEHPVVDFEALFSNVKSNELTTKMELPVVFGATEIDNPLIVDLAKLPHLLVAGSTGSGKSIFLHSIINSLINSACDINLKLALVDPKFVEFSKYNKSPALMYPVINDAELAEQMIDQLLAEVERRLKVFKKYDCRDCQEYRAKVKKIPYIVFVIDELADLMKVNKKVMETKLCLLVQKCRAAGIFGIVGTQHPSAKVITGDIKANFPAKVAFKVSTHTHSRVILDRNGAERLMGKGDGLFLEDSGEMRRFKGAFISNIKNAKTSLEKPKPGLLSAMLSAVGSKKKGR